MMTITTQHSATIAKTMRGWGDEGTMHGRVLGLVMRARRRDQPIRSNGGAGWLLLFSRDSEGDKLGAEVLPRDVFAGDGVRWGNLFLSGWSTMV